MNEVRKNSVLVVDDENSNILALTHILSPEYTVYAAKSGEAAIKAAEKYLPDVILLDIVMPEMDGYDVIAALKKSEKTQNIPVIFATGLSGADDEEKGLALGTSDYITKPFSPAIVRLRVKNQMKLIEQFRSNEYEIMKYKLSNDALNIAMWDMDVVSGDPINPKNRIVYSGEFRNMLGFSDEADFPNTLGSWNDRLHPEDREMTINAFAAHINDYAGKTPFNIEYRLLMKNGKDYRYFHALGTTQRDSTGIPLRVAGALMDITEKKQMEEKAHEDEERMLLMLDTMPFACGLINRDHEFIYMNNASVSLFGVTGKDNPTENYLAILPEFQPCGRRSLELSHERFEKAFTEGYQRYECLYSRPDGELVPCEETLICVKHRGEPILAAYARDLREQKAIIEEMRRAEIAEESNKAKSLFLANMSHEMRTPMNVIVGLTDLILEEEDPAVNLKENLKKINTAGNILLELINDVLDLSKVEAGRLELTPVKYEVPSLLNDIIALNMIRIEDKPIKFLLDIEEGLLHSLYGDDLRVKQIINNLLSNAFKYTRQGSVTLGMRCEHEGCDVWVSIYVSDTGIGIRREDLKKLFTNYAQVDTHTNRAIEGTGLGLSIAKRIAELMNGEIIAESEYGKGTVFRVRFRQGFVDDTPIGPVVVENLRKFRYAEDKRIVGKKFVRADLSYAKVLVVDDMQTNLDVAAALLRKYKMQVDCALSGPEAYERMRKGEPVYNAIFMDHMMPGMDGIEATAAIRALGTEYARNIPIIALTANAIQGMESVFYANGFQAFIPKPIDVMRLDSIIRKWIRNKSGA